MELLKAFIPQALWLLNVLGTDKARFVGGCVRDALIGRNFEDIDIATSLSPAEVMQRLKKEDVKVLPTGIAHGTVTAIVNHHPFEITTLRKDTACDGRHAEVSFTDDWKEDAARRDFTMNALYLDGYGKLYDFFSGEEDLRNSIVRFVGDPEQRITEDYLRVLRLFRFQARYGKGEILENQIDACSSHIASVTRLSGERIQQEMIKLLAAPEILHVMKTMNRIELLSTLVLDRAAYVNLRVLQGLEEITQKPDPMLRLAAILLGALEIEEKRVRELASFWRLSNEMRFTLLTLVVPVFQLDATADEATLKKAMRIVGRDIFHKLVYLSWAKYKSTGGEKDAPYQAMLRLADGWEVPSFPLKGKDVMELGVSPGEDIGRLLRHAEMYWEEHDYEPNKEDLIFYLQKELGTV